jgi:hypothetical protein
MATGSLGAQALSDPHECAAPGAKAIVVHSQPAWRQLLSRVLRRGGDAYDSAGIYRRCGSAGRHRRGPGRSALVDRPGLHGMIIVLAGQKERDALLADSQTVVDESNERSASNCRSSPI